MPGLVDLMQGETITFHDGITYVVGRGWFTHGEPMDGEQVTAKWRSRYADPARQRYRDDE